MGAADRNPRPGVAAAAAAIGIDVGGTKIAAGLVDTTTGALVERRLAPDTARAGRSAGARGLCGARGGARRRRAASRDRRSASSSTSRAGRRAATPSTGAGSTSPAAIGAPRVVVEADVRAAALAEARFGAGAGASPFLFVVVGTGASACLVADGRPYTGARGEALVLGAPPVERVASGPALARAAGLERAEDVLADPRACAARRRRRGDPRRRARGARQRARPVARRPRRRSRSRDVVPGARRACASGRGWRTPATPPLPVVSSALGPDGGVVGAALVAAAGRG